jgi:hypothetical protein
MQIDELNKLLEGLSAYDLPPFDDDGLTSARLKDGNLLNIYAAEETLMLFMQVEVLGNVGEDHPEIFRDLLHSNIIGGKFGNLRIVYDDDSTAVWLCHDIPLETINADRLSDEVDRFAANAPLLIGVLREDIITAYMDLESEEAAAENRKKTEELTAVNIANFLSV